MIGPTSPDVKKLLGSLSVLVVEDSREMRHLLEALLFSMGIRDVVTAATAQMGLRLFAEHAPDLVITDGAMQPMDGYEMTRRIRRMNKQGHCVHVPVLMISGISDSETVRRARDEGVTDYIVKPVTPSLLFERILAAVVTPVHLIERGGFRSLSTKRKLIAHSA